MGWRRVDTTLQHSTDTHLLLENRRASESLKPRAGCIFKKRRSRTCASIPPMSSYVRYSLQQSESKLASLLRAIRAVSTRQTSMISMFEIAASTSASGSTRLLRQWISPPVSCTQSSDREAPAHGSRCRAASPTTPETCELRGKHRGQRRQSFTTTRSHLELRLQLHAAPGCGNSHALLAIATRRIESVSRKTAAPLENFS